jgi:hypothetical protein
MDLNSLHLRPILLSRAYLLKTYAIVSIILQTLPYFQIDTFQEVSPPKAVHCFRTHSSHVHNIL